MILFILFACFFNKPQPPKHVHANVEVVDAEIEITFVQGE